MENTDGDLASFEGKYPKDLFNKVVIVNGQSIGHVAKETDDTIVVFSDSDDLRFDVPKSKIGVAGGSVIVNEPLDQYKVDRAAPLPESESLRPAAEEIRQRSAEQLEVESRRTTPDAIMEERTQLEAEPRPETATVSRPEGYVDTESEIVKQMKGALAELKEVIVAGSRVAKRKAKEAQAQADEKRAEMDADSISRMGGLAARFADSFEDVLSEIRTRTYADQAQIYSGFVKLIDQQRDLVIARRDLALRLKDSVPVPVVDKPQLDAPPELPEDINESRTLNERTAARKKRTVTKTRKRKA
jgi:hypothetical protein